MSCNNIAIVATLELACHLWVASFRRGEECYKSSSLGKLDFTKKQFLQMRYHWKKL
jgi:hypothetical protein